MLLLYTEDEGIIPLLVGCMKLTDLKIECFMDHTRSCIRAISSGFRYGGSGAGPQLESQEKLRTAEGT